jgi:hypothetical protein
MDGYRLNTLEVLQVTALSPLHSIPLFHANEQYLQPAVSLLHTTLLSKAGLVSVMDFVLINRLFTSCPPRKLTMSTALRLRCCYCASCANPVPSPIKTSNACIILQIWFTLFAFLTWTHLKPSTKFCEVKYARGVIRARLMMSLVAYIDPDGGIWVETPVFCEIDLTLWSYRLPENRTVVKLLTAWT